MNKWKEIHVHNNFWIRGFSELCPQFNPHSRPIFGTQVNQWLCYWSSVMQNFTPLLIPFSWDFLNWYLKIIRWENMRVFWPAIFNINQGRVSEAFHIYKAHLSLLLPHHEFHFMFMKRVCSRFRYKHGLEILTTTYAFKKYFFSVISARKVDFQKA